MKKTPDDLKAKVVVSDRIAKEFCSSAIPMAFIEMPGCYEIVVNQAHEREFESGSRMCSDMDEFRAAWITASDRDRAERRGTLCLCAKDQSILALETAHCAYESVRDSLIQGGAGAWERRLGYFSLQQNGSRSYKPYIVDSSLLDRRQGSEDEQWIIHSRLIPTGGATVTVLTEGPHLKIVVGDERDVWLESAEEMRREGTYLQVDECLSEACARLNKGEDIDAVKDDILQFVGGIATHYEPVVAWVGSLFFQAAANREERKEKSVHLISRARERIYDAPAVSALEKRCDLVSYVESKSCDVFDLDRIAFEENSESFDAQYEQLKEHYGNKFVALFKGRVVDSGSDRTALLKRLQEQGLLHRRMLVIHVPTEESSLPHIKLGGPRLG